LSVFTPAEIEYLRGQTLGRLATVGPDGQPHVIPLTYWYNAEEDTIDLGGINFGEGKKWRDAARNPRATFLVDDVIPEPRRARALEVRGIAELHETGGDRINPRFPKFADQFIRLRPTRIVSGGVEQGGTDAAGFRVNASSVR
jgi:pyridoxamine 5'-phosphate oxidase family protein